VVARLCQEKGVDLFIDAVYQVAAAIATASFVVVGDGPARPALEVRARTAGLADRITFLGMLHSAREVITSLDLLVVPSRTDGTPLVVLEAQAAGKAVVATRVGGIPEQIEHGVDGWLVPAEDPAALAVAIHTLLADRALRDRLGAGGRCRAARWPHAAMVDRAEAVYAAVLDERAVIPPSLRSLDFLSSV
jgi:glycosyltransferase involved in cell wall biosynthesis